MDTGKIKMKIIKKGISNDLFIGQCESCSCVVSCTRKELNDEGRKSFPLNKDEEVPSRVSSKCPECGNSLLDLWDTNSKKGDELYKKYLLNGIMENGR